MPLTQRRIFRFWLPLALMWVMMALEQPILAAVIARLPQPKEQLAAFGITFSLALLIEGPIIMLLTASTALAKGSQSSGQL
jgi:Na+-driven multidrug efflux pump